MTFQFSGIHHSSKKSFHSHAEDYWSFSENNVTSHKRISEILSGRTCNEDLVPCNRGDSVSVCERCHTRLASITCLDCCLDKICVKCCQFLHSDERRIHHGPFFIKHSDNNITKNESSDKKCLKSLCHNALLLCGEICDESKSNSRQTIISELQKIRKEKRLSNLIEQEEAEKKRLKLEKENVTIQINNGANQLQNFSRNFLEKLRKKKPKDCIQRYTSVSQALIDLSCSFYINMYDFM